MMVIVSQNDLVEVMAQDNVINALIARMFIAISNGNAQLASYYQKEIEASTSERASAIHNLRYAEPAFELSLVRT